MWGQILRWRGVCAALQGEDLHIILMDAGLGVLTSNREEWATSTGSRTAENPAFQGSLKSDQPRYIHPKSQFPTSSQPGP